MSEWFIGKIERLDNEPLNEIRRLKQREIELEDAIKAALDISTLWSPTTKYNIVYVEDETGLEALSKMHKRFRELVS